jgi:hypothetical protein
VNPQEIVRVFFWFCERDLPMTRIAVALAVVFAALTVSAQDKQQPAEKQAPLKPQKEHEFLKQFEGEWDVRSKCFLPAIQENQGTDVSKVKLGGFWLMCHYKSEHDGQPFEGHAMMGFDPKKGMFIGTWTDSWCPNLMRFEGKADAAGKVFTMNCEGADPKTGQPANFKMIHEIGNKDHRTLRFTMLDKDSKEVLMSEMLFTRSGTKKETK